MQLVRCTLLTITFGILLITASCGDEIVVPTSGAAGRVISVEGKVTATKGGQKPRALKIDDMVFVEDTVTTAPEATVVIGLTHNNATWTVKENQEKRVQGSLAWTATKQKAGIFASKEDSKTAAAASNHEKQAGETSATLMQADREEPPPPEPQLERDKNKQRESPPPTEKAKKQRRKRGPQKGRSPPPANNRTAEIKQPIPTPVPPPAPPKITADSTTVTSAEATRSLIKRLAAECKSKVTTKGVISYHLIIKNGTFKSFTAKGMELGAFNSCMRTKIKAANLTPLGSAKGTLKFQ